MHFEMCYKYIILDSEIFSIETFIFSCDFDHKCLADVRGLERRLKGRLSDVFVSNFETIFDQK